jgi:Ca2+:H+ antiporter
MYCGEDLGDLIVVTLNNTVEATLAIILLFRCELKLLQSTITGVVLLHLLLIPGTAFFTGGARILEQQLHPQRSQLNHTLLTVGVLALTIPVAFFAAINGSGNDGAEGVQGPSDTLRADFLGMSRGFAVILLFIYIGSRFYLHDPPGKNNAFSPRPDIPPELLRREKELEEAEPDVNPWACVILLIVCVALVGVTAEFLVESIEYVRERGNIEEEWFGIILLPIVSFSADGAIAIVYFLRSFLRRFITAPQPPDLLAETRAIDLSIQFLLFWMPLVTLLGWWLNKPMSMLFDLFEVVLLVGACFLVNYVTADAKTNWAEGFVLLSFYIMIGISAWYYPGQNESRVMNACEGIVEAIANGVIQDD